MLELRPLRATTALALAAECAVFDSFFSFPTGVQDGRPLGPIQKYFPGERDVGADIAGLS